jgi:hypothetical protein
MSYLGEEVEEMEELDEVDEVDDDSWSLFGGGDSSRGGDLTPLCSPEKVRLWVLRED